jgi:hypothetical protein
MGEGSWKEGEGVAMGGEENGMDDLDLMDFAREMDENGRG